MKEFKGQLKGFPEEIVNKMCDYQVAQGNKRDVSVFEKYPMGGTIHGGFSWWRTHEGKDWWTDVIRNKNFPLFFEKYPKKNAYPKVMMVSNYPFNSENEGRKRVVFMEKNDEYITWLGAETIEDSEKEMDTIQWKYAKDIEEEKEEDKEFKVWQEYIKTLRALTQIKPIKFYTLENSIDGKLATIKYDKKGKAKKIIIHLNNK